MYASVIFAKAQQLPHTTVWSALEVLFLKGEGPPRSRSNYTTNIWSGWVGNAKYRRSKSDVQMLCGNNGLRMGSCCCMKRLDKKSKSWWWRKMLRHCNVNYMTISSVCTGIYRSWANGGDHLSDSQNSSSYERWRDRPGISVQYSYL